MEVLPWTRASQNEESDLQDLPHCHQSWHADLAEVIIHHVRRVSQPCDSNGRATAVIELCDYSRWVPRNITDMGKYILNNKLNLDSTTNLEEEQYAFREERETVGLTFYLRQLKEKARNSTNIIL